MNYRNRWLAWDISHPGLELTMKVRENWVQTLALSLTISVSGQITALSFLCVSVEFLSCGME